MSSITKNGFTTTIASLGNQFKNKSTVESISLLVNYVLENSISKDDIAIRSATVNTLEEMSLLLGDNNSLTEIESKYLLQYFTRELIWQLMLVDYVYSFEKRVAIFKKLLGLKEILRNIFKLALRWDLIHIKMTTSQKIHLIRF